MIVIIVNFIALLCAISLVSRTLQYFETNEYSENKRFCLIFLGVALACVIISGTMTYLLPASSLGFIFYALKRIMEALILVDMVILCEGVVGIEDTIISKVISMIMYSSMFLFFVDIIVNKGELSRNDFGVFVNISLPLHRIIYYFVHIIFAIILFSFIIYRASFAYKKREEYEVVLLGISLGSCILSFVFTLFMSFYSVNYYNFSNILLLISSIFMFILIKYHRSISICEDDYREELSPNRDDAVFVISDDLTVLYINNRADVYRQIYQDTFIGRKITEIFEFSENEKREIINNKEKEPFGLSAEYAPSKKFVNMVVENRFDRFGEIITSTIMIYNMDAFENNANNKQEEKSNANIDEMIETAIEYTRDKRILLVDEDIKTLNEIQNLLIPYEMKVTRAINGNGGIDKVINGEFDIIFISEDMLQLSAEETASKIRSLPGDYYSDVPIICITASDVKNIFLQMLEAGFSDFLSKPVQATSLNLVLTRWVWKSFSKEE